MGMELIEIDLKGEESVTNKFIEYFRKHYVLSMLPYKDADKIFKGRSH